MDDFDLKCLPTDFVGTSKPSKKLQEFYERKERTHKKIIEDIHERKHEVCKNFEILFQNHSDKLKQNLNDIKALIKNELFEARIKSNHDNANNLEKNYFKILYNSIHDYTSKMHKHIEDFYIELIKMEKEKSKKFTKILKDGYELLKQNAYKLPNQTDELIELEIENVNQTILCNNRNYLELKTQLQAEIQNYNKNAILDLKLVRECWVNFVRGQTEKSLGDLKHQYSPEILKTMEKLKEKAEEAGTNLNNMDHVQDANRWLNNMRHALAQLDQKAQKLMMSYKQATVLIYHRCFQELKSIEDAMSELAEPEPVSKTQLEMYTPTLEEITKIYDVELETIQRIWNNLVDEMTKTVDNTYKFLVASSILWKNHFWRTEILQVIMLKDMENAVQEHNAVSELAETKLNVLIDALRQEHSKEKLKKTSEDINKTWSTLENLYKTQYQTESGILKKYKQVHELRVDVLLEEVRRFLALYPPDPEKDPKLQRKRASQTSEIADTTENLISKQMLYCKFQIGAISNWQFGLWESIRNYSSLAKAEILAESEKWVHSHMQRVDRRLEVRLRIHVMRMKIIESYIYEERLEELCVHQSRFEEHTNAVEKRMESLKDEFKLYQDKFETIVNAYKEEIAKSEISSIDSKNSFILIASIQVLNRRTEKCLEEIDNLILEYFNKCDGLFDRVKVSNVLFAKNIKLFCEEGNYSIPEIKDLLKNMEKIEAQAEKALNSIRKNVDINKQQIIVEINTKKSEVLTTLNAVKDEYKFIENVDQKLEILKQKLTKEVCMFQGKFKLLTEQFKLSKEQMIKHYGNYDFLKDFSEQLKSMTQNIKELADYLDESHPIRIFSDKTAIELEIQEGTPVGMLQHHKPKEQRIDELTRKLFNFEISNDNKYFMKLSRLMQEYWNDIIVYGRNFYATHNRCFYLDNELIEPGLVRLMSDLYKKFYQMQNQCETRTLEDTKNFIFFATECVTFLQDFIVTYIDEYARKTLRNFEVFNENEVKGEIRRSKQNIKKLFEELHQKLKPLYGHPTNKKILEKLQIESESIYSDAKEMFEDFKEPFLEKLNDQFVKGVDDFYALKDTIPPIIKLINDVPIIVDDLSRKLNEKVYLLKKMLEFSQQGTITKADQKLIIDHWKSFLTLYDSKLPKPLTSSNNNVPYLANSDEQSAETSHSISSMEASFSTKSPPSSLTNSPGISVSYVSSLTQGTEDMDMFSIDMREAYNKYYMEVKNENFEQMLKCLKMQWNQAVMKVMSLYTVKYDQKYKFQNYFMFFTFSQLLEKGCL